MTQPATIKILLVEDNPGDALLVEVMLEETGSDKFELTNVGRLNEAIERLIEEKFDVVLLDLSLPDSSGLETVTQIRTAKPDVPVVVLSGLNNEEVALQALQSGAQDYLIKDQGDGDLIARSIRYSIERKRVEERLRSTVGSLLALHEAGQILGSTLKREEIGSWLLELVQRVSNLEAAVIDLKDEQQRLRPWHAAGSEDLRRLARSTPEAQAARRKVLEAGERQLFRLRRPDNVEGAYLVGLYLPLRVRDRLIGILETYGPDALAEEGTVETIATLAGQAASALENARLYEELAERERRLHDLVGRVLAAQEEERRRVVYEVHDGLAQTATAAHQLLQAFARDYSPGSAEGRKNLDRVLELVEQTVGEARQVIADLRPTVLDDFGLATAIRSQVERLGGEDRWIDYEETLRGERLPAAVETTLYRVAQEALTNVRKHAFSTRARVTLQRVNGSVRLRVRDWGRGFDLDKVTNGGGPGERVGLSSMQQRVTLLGGSLEVRSEPGAGTEVVAEVPLPEEHTEHEG